MMIQFLRLVRAVAGSDRDLLDRYIRDRDEEAFAELVRRYGTGVWAASVRLAGPDAEDVFQSVFLIMSRKSETVSGSLPAWLHTVTRRVASTLRRGIRRRSRVETAAAHPEIISSTDPGMQERLAWLDEELSRLPERYRAVLIVCCLEGRSRDEAAAQLGWSEGQVKGRLERAREMLRARLARRGIEFGGMLLAATMAGPAPVRANSPSIVAVTLTQGVIRAMAIQKLKLTAAVLMISTCIVIAGGMMLRAQSGDPVDSTPAANKVVQEPPKIPKELLEKRVETARKVYEAYLTRYRTRTGYLSDLFGWSERLLEAELALADKRTDRVKALEAHLERTRKVESVVLNSAKVGDVNQAEVDAAAYYRLEAEIRLHKEGVLPKNPEEKSNTEKK